MSKWSHTGTEAVPYWESNGPILGIKTGCPDKELLVFLFWAEDRKEERRAETLLSVFL
jgi:hypothetical protein